jgi:hypothetical protein
MNDSDVQKTLQSLLTVIAGERVQSGTGVTQQLEQLRLTVQGQRQAVSENTQAVLKTAAAQTYGGAAETAGNFLKTFFKSGLGLSPLVSGIVSLFGGGGVPEPPPLAPFRLPAPVHFAGGISETGGGAIRSLDYGAGDRPRLIPAPAAAPQITVQVQAMDSRSFLDHRDEIARAVREAMLTSYSLGDVVKEM